MAYSLLRPEAEPVCARREVEGELVDWEREEAADGDADTTRAAAAGSIIECRGRARRRGGGGERRRKGGEGLVLG